MKNVGVTAGASAPEHLVQELIEFLRERGFQQMEEIELVEEDVRFSLPAELTDLDPMSAPSQVGNTLELAAEQGHAHGRRTTLLACRNATATGARC